MFYLKLKIKLKIVYSLFPWKVLGKIKLKICLPSRSLLIIYKIFRIIFAYKNLR